MGGQQLSVEMSIGIALWLGRSDYKRVLDQADLVMYQAKQNGKQRHHLLWL